MLFYFGYVYTKPGLVSAVGAQLQAMTFLPGVRLFGTELFLFR